MAYLVVVVTCGICVTLSRIINIPNGTLNLTNTPILDTFGYNNICVYIDETPAKYVGIVGWEIFNMLFLVYEITFWARSCLVNYWVTTHKERPCGFDKTVFDSFAIV